MLVSLRMQICLPLGCACLALALGTFACSRPAPTSGSGDGPSSRAESSLLTIKGSDTMLHLVNAWAEEFMNRSESAELSVNGGGSGTGIAALINKSTDLCMSSRDMKPEEKQKATENGIVVKEIAVARDGIVVAVNPENPVSQLSREQLEKIFMGAYSRWSEIGGADEPIMVVSRESSSGTYVYFQEHVLNKKDFVQGALLLNSTNAIVQAVSEDKNAIGYIGLGYAAEAGASVKVLSISGDAGGDPVLPTEASVISGQYPIARALYLYAAEPLSPTTQSFVDFCLSPDGQKIVKDAGYVSIQ